MHWTVLRVPPVQVYSGNYITSYIHGRIQWISWVHNVTTETDTFSASSNCPSACPSNFRLRLSWVRCRSSFLCLSVQAPDDNPLALLNTVVSDRRCPWLLLLSATERARIFNQATSPQLFLFFPDLTPTSFHGRKLYKPFLSSSNITKWVTPNGHEISSLCQTSCLPKPDIKPTKYEINFLRHLLWG